MCCKQVIVTLLILLKNFKYLFLFRILGIDVRRSQLGSFQRSFFKKPRRHSHSVRILIWGKSIIYVYNRSSEAIFIHTVKQTVNQCFCTQNNTELSLAVFEAYARSARAQGAGRWSGFLSRT